MRGGGRATPGYNPVVQRLAPPASKWDLLPGGHQIRGVNITGRLNASTPTYLPDLWHNWEWDTGGSPGSAGNWIKWQIDAAKASAANTVRFFGTLQGRVGSGSSYANPLDDATYFARWDQFLAYCRQQGLYVYPCLDGDTTACDGGAYTNFTPTLAWRQSEVAKVVRFLMKYADIIIGVDLVSECTTWAAASGQGQALYNTAKSEAPYLQFTYSHDVHSAAAITTPFGAAQSMKDFNDLHCYYDPAPTVFDTVMSTSGKPLLIGEFGQNMNAGTTARQSRVTTVGAVLSNVTSGRRAAGGLWWALAPQDTASSNDFGMYDATGNQRSDIATQYAALPN